ncbi:MAG: RluA family pseudouridine synthase, partial [bacterium]|nr:RluA family pseudouridine synthase [bacterium]
MEIVVVYEDKDIVVIDKPVGVICNRAETVKVETLQDWWEDKYKV